ncbi:MAG TPA: BBP7 family outer membrane beta-barrel protein [Gemmataceae bacterium]|nr:BBP7 family outer membrane beta-barrel protein [Gemmataceae bacterium]
MRSGWVSATVAVFLTAGWAAAQAPVPSATDNSGSTYSFPARPVQAAPTTPRVAAGAVSPGGVSAGTYDPYPPPGPTPGIPVAQEEPGHDEPWYDHIFGDLPEKFPPPYRVWASGEFLVWRIPSGHLPALTAAEPIGVIYFKTENKVVSATGAPVQDIVTTTFAPLSIMSVSAPATGNSIDLGEQFGGRFTAGVWFDTEECVGLESTFFFINDRSTWFDSSTDHLVNQGVINLPGSSIFTVLAPAGTTSATGTVSTVQSVTAFVVRQANTDLSGRSSTGIWGGEANLRCTSPSLGAVSGLVGFRYLNFHEDLDVHNAVQLFQPAGFVDSSGIVGGPSGSAFTNFPTAFSFSTNDAIQTHNLFYGPQVGIDLDMYIGRLLLDLRAKAALGVMHQTVDIASTSTLSDGTTVAGGLLSAPFDQGSHSRNRIAFVPEINVKVGYVITPWLRAYVGYDFLYLSSVVRPGDQTGISTSGVQAAVAGTTSQITVNQPAFRFSSTDMIINGINFGVEFRY